MIYIGILASCSCCVLKRIPGNVTHISCSGTIAIATDTSSSARYSATNEAVSCPQRAGRASLTQQVGSNGAGPLNLYRHSSSLWRYVSVIALLARSSLLRKFQSIRERRSVMFSASGTMKRIHVTWSFWRTWWSVLLWNPSISLSLIPFSVYFRSCSLFPSLLPFFPSLST
jgi:hypothetical protein